MTRIVYEMSNDEFGSLGASNENEKSIGKWIFTPNCATSYSIKFNDNYLTGLEIKSDDTVSPPQKKNTPSEQEAVNSN